MLIIQNKGTGAGGKNTNKNGLDFEKNTTNIENNVKILKVGKYFKKVLFRNEKILVKVINLKYFQKECDLTVEKAHGCKKPDECYYDEQLKIIYIIEKKFQQCAGSVCEKIQTVDFKKWQYSRMFPNHNVVYMYSLSNWFKKNCKAEIEYLTKIKKIPVFWGESETYRDDIINFIFHYK